MCALILMEERLININNYVIIVMLRKEEESRSKRELEEIKWKKEMIEVEMELGVAKARFVPMKDYDDSATRSEGKSLGSSYCDVEQWVTSSNQQQQLAA